MNEFRPRPRRLLRGSRFLCDLSFQGTRPRAARRDLRAALFVACVFSGCTPVGSSDKSDAPVGVLVEASAGLPALEIAISTRPAGLEDGLVQPIADAVRSGLRACEAHDLPSSAARAPMTLDFKALHGKLSAATTASAAAHEPTLAACLSAQLSRANMTARPELEGVTLRVRATHPPAPTGSTASAQ